MWIHWQLRNGEHLHSTTLSKIQKIYTSPVRHFSFPNSTLLHRIPEGSLPPLPSPTPPRLLGSSHISATCNQVLQIYLASAIQTVHLFSLKSFTFLSKNFFFLSVLRAQAMKTTEKWRLFWSNSTHLSHDRCHHHQHDQNNNMTWHWKSVWWPRSVHFLNDFGEPYTLSDFVLVAHTKANSMCLYGSHILVHENRWFKSTRKQRNA